MANQHDIITSRQAVRKGRGALSNRESRYQGCEHGCIYCYARPTHAHLDLSPGLDFETRLTYKPNAAEQLEKELARPGYRCQGITLGANTDPYQPVEKKYGITRQLLEVLRRHRHPVSIITKGSLVTRDLDILEEMAAADYDTRFGHRMRGTGIFANLLAKRFEVCCRRLGLRQGETPRTRTDLFRPPEENRPQYELFS